MKQNKIFFSCFAACLVFLFIFVPIAFRRRISTGNIYFTEWRFIWDIASFQIMLPLLFLQVSLVCVIFGVYYFLFLRNK